MRINAVSVALFLTALIVGTAAPVIAQTPVLENLDYLSREAKANKIPSIALSETTSLGSGYATNVGSMRSPSMILTSKDSKPVAGIFYDYKFVENTEQLHSALSVSATTGYGVPAAGGTARLQLLQEASMSRTKAYVLFRMTVLSRKDALVDYRLHSAALGQMSKPLDFYAKYGDSFVSSITYGGELLALLEFSSADQLSSEALRAAVSLRIGRANADADFASSLKTLTSGFSVYVRYRQAGGSLASQGIVVTTPAQIVARATAFPKEVADSPTTADPLFAELKDYSVVENLPTGVVLVPLGGISPRIEAVARVALVMREEVATAQEIQSAGAIYPPALRNAAQSRQEYANYTLTVLRGAFDEAITAPRAANRALLESYIQYWGRRQLKVGSNTQRQNVEALCDATDPDTASVQKCLFGTSTPLPVEKWPRIAVKTARLVVTNSEKGIAEYQAKISAMRSDPLPHPEWSVTHLIRCDVIVTNWAHSFCGKTGPADGVFVSVETLGRPIGGGCGYTPYAVTCVTTEQPQRKVLPDSEDYTLGALVGKPPAPQLTVLGQHYRIALQVPAASCPSAFGNYVITVTRKQDGERLSESSYWYRKTKGEFQLEHFIPISFGAIEDDVKLKLETVLCAPA